MVVATPLAPPHPMHAPLGLASSSSEGTMNSSSTSRFKRDVDQVESMASVSYSPSKRRSPSSDTLSPPSSPVLSPKPIRSALVHRSPQPGTMASISAMGAAGESYRQGMYLVFVKNALAERAKGNTVPYVELLLQFQDPGPSATLNTTTAQIRSWLSALSHVVSALDRSHTKLVENILALPWTSMSESFAHMWIKFVCSLVSARGEWLTTVLSKAAKSLSYRLEWKSVNFAQGVDDQEIALPKRRQVYDRVHLLLRSLLSIIPTLPAILAPLLLKHFPHKRVERAGQLVYVKNILRISQYCAELSEGILSAVIDRAIQLDVEIQVELDDLEDDELQDLGLKAEDPFDQAIDEEEESDDDSEDGDIDGIDDLSDDGDDMNPTEVVDQDDGKTVDKIKESVSKLDAIMVALFEHLGLLNNQYTNAMEGQTSSSSSHMDRLDGDMNRRNLFRTLLVIFEKAILPTFKSRHVQFLLFWFNSLDPEFAEIFLGLLLRKSLFWREYGDAEVSPVIQLASASYVASLVSRATYIDATTTRMVILHLCTFLDTHIDRSVNPETEAGAAAPGSGVHSTFYAVSQAIFYIFCFRWRDLKLTAEAQDGELEQDGDDFGGGGLHSSIGGLTQAVTDTWCDGLNVVQRSITSRLNPLKYCSSNVVKQFARIAQHTGFLYCYSVIEANNRSLRPRGTVPSRSTSMSLVEAALAESSQDASDRGTPRPSEAAADTKALPDPISTSSVLEAFFPFDPYKLGSSAIFVDPLYREWADVAPEEDDDDDSDDSHGSDSDNEQDDDDDDDDEDQDEQNLGGVDIPGSSYNQSLAGDEADGDEFVSQVVAMSISPYHT